MRLLFIGVCAATLAAAQVPRVGEVELYGFRKVKEETARRALNVKAGDALPPSRGDLEERLELIPGVVRARVEAVCCENGNAVLFAGVEERGASHFAFRSPPTGIMVLPGALAGHYAGVVASLEAAARRGSTSEDLTRGHALMADPATRELQEQLVPLASGHLTAIRGVLRDAADPAARAAAAAVIGYAPDKKAVLDDLQYALQDPDESVRAAALRSLTAIGVLAAREPSLGIRIPFTWFVEMLNSLVLSDRTRAAAALVNLTETDAASALAQIRERALDSVVEMARWKTLRYALPAFILAGRVAGMGQKEIEAAWTAGDREGVLQRLRPAKRGD